MSGRLPSLKVAGLVLAGLVALPTPARAQTEQVEYYALDAIGSVRTVFDASGAVAARLDYEPFGKQVSASNAGPDRKFAGLFRDAEACPTFTLHAAERPPVVAALIALTRPDPIGAATA
jgi:hypothetical protein